MRTFPFCEANERQFLKAVNQLSGSILSPYLPSPMCSMACRLVTKSYLPSNLFGGLQISPWTKEMFLNGIRAGLMSSTSSLRLVPIWATKPSMREPISMCEEGLSELQYVLQFRS